jgi:hypothetical protein
VNHQRRRCRSIHIRSDSTLSGGIRSVTADAIRIDREVNDYSLQSESLRLRKNRRFSVAGLACQLHSKESS